MSPFSSRLRSPHPLALPCSPLPSSLARALRSLTHGLLRGATGRSGVHGPGQRINISSRSRSQSSHWAMHNHEFNSCTASSLHILPMSQCCAQAKHTLFLTVDTADLEGLTSGDKPAPAPNFGFILCYYITVGC